VIKHVHGVDTSPVTISWNVQHAVFGEAKALSFGLCRCFPKVNGGGALDGNLTSKETAHVALEGFYVDVEIWYNYVRERVRAPLSFLDNFLLSLVYPF